MNKRTLITIFMAVSMMMLHAQVQEDSYLQEIAKVVKGLRKNPKSFIDSAVETLSADKNPKITLMDEIRWAGKEEDRANEIKGRKGNRFNFNQVIARVYKKQNNKLESKDETLNGNEKDIHFSAIEKSVKHGGKVTYKIAGRMGNQDFMFIPYNQNSKYTVDVNCGGKSIRRPENGDAQVGDCYIRLENISRKQEIFFTINYLDDKANKDLVESFVIINYNPQK